MNERLIICDPCSTAFTEVALITHQQAMHPLQNTKLDQILAKLDALEALITDHLDAHTENAKAEMGLFNDRQANPH